jgi:hypothetical protein
MKQNRHYAAMPAPVNDLKPEQADMEMHTQFRMEPRVLDAYAHYLSSSSTPIVPKASKSTPSMSRMNPTPPRTFPAVYGHRAI